MTHKTDWVCLNFREDDSVTLGVLMCLDLSNVNGSKQSWAVEKKWSTTNILHFLARSSELVTLFHNLYKYT